MHLFYLPVYSPGYNPVELFWKWIKPKVHGFSALGGINDLIKRFRKYVWHFNNRRLVNPIKLNFKTYQVRASFKTFNFEVCAYPLKVKEGENFNHRNM
ncbi:MAG TPA: hypothetical protein DDW42_07595 [Desulfobacteraceae bacterium]|nr:hypothetical protein [Desulfobacteraceae bacterium]